MRDSAPRGSHKITNLDYGDSPVSQVDGFKRSPYIQSPFSPRYDCMLTTEPPCL
jgi:hypothetical protein